MVRFFKKISHYGTSPGFSSWQNRNIIIANSIAASLCFLLILLALLFILFYVPDFVLISCLFVIAFLNFLILFISKSGHPNTSRFLLTIVNCLGVLSMSVIEKNFAFRIYDATYHETRTGLLLLCIIPMAVFELDERKLLLGNLLVGFLVLMLFDPVHYMFNVDYYQMGLQEPRYYFVNAVYFVLYLFIVGCFGFFKNNMESFEKKNLLLLKSLKKETETVQEQKKDLESKNFILEKLITEKDKDLSKVTGELFRYNQELLEYSYTLSHKIRGPVASVLGLLKLIEITRDQRDIREYLKKLEQSVLALDNIIYDLNNIADIQQESYQKKDLVYFSDEYEKVVNHLRLLIRDHNIKITEDFHEAPEIYSVQEKIYYILNELITNAIQFRKPDHQLEIKVKTYKKDEYVTIEVKDNGFGMDLDAYGEELFKPFKRFHPDSSGTGLGLYILRLIVEKLDGEISAESSSMIGTIFKVKLKNKFK